MIKVGQKVKVVYDPRPIYPRQEVEGTIVKITSKGFLKIKTGTPYWDEARFYSPLTPSPGRRHAVGWNTLWWEPLS